MKPTYIITVPHSGTTSLLAMYLERNIRCKSTHCEKVYEIAIPRILEEFHVVTTFREPRLVAASWARRQHGGFDKPQTSRRWMANWTRWKMLVEGGANVYTMDELDKHENADPYIRPGAIYMVPKHLLDFAEECASVLRS